jgi:hypothetical protein
VGAIVSEGEREGEGDGLAVSVGALVVGRGVGTRLVGWLDGLELNEGTLSALGIGEGSGDSVGTPGKGLKVGRRIGGCGGPAVGNGVGCGVANTTS